jgi:UDP-N-acetylmuramoylalanine--D-glutamate ligase
MRNIKVGSVQKEVNRMLEIRKELANEQLNNQPSGSHRMQSVKVVNGIEYMNDSRSTDIDSTWYTLSKVEKPVVWIAGGVDKGNDYMMIKDLVKEKVKAIVCLGANNQRLFEAFQFEVPMMIIDASSAAEAVQLSTIAAKKGDLVLLSPACPSYDMFESFEDRGDQFIKAVNNIKEVE